MYIPLYNVFLTETVWGYKKERKNALGNIKSFSVNAILT